MPAVMLLFLSIVLLLPSASKAHELRPTIADITTTDHTIDIRLRVNLEALISEIGPDHENVESAPQASRYDQLRLLAPDKLEEEFVAYLPTLLSQLSISDESELDSSTSVTYLPVVFDNVVIPEAGDIRLPRDTELRLTAALDPDVTAISWQWDEQLGPLILRFTPAQLDGKTQGKTQGDGQVQGDALAASQEEMFNQYLKDGQSSQRIALSADVAQSSGSGFIDYVVIGFEHIIPKGLDHILFVIGLFLLAPRLKPIVWQVSMFTLAHSVTLALGITGIIALPASIVEPLIALSITLICVENIIARQRGSQISRIRLVVVFAFGLLHGLGFAGVLSDIGLQSNAFFSSLLAFNIGVELGQLAVVLICFALVGWWFGSKPWYRKIISIPASLVIGAVGLFWFVQRIV